MTVVNLKRAKLAVLIRSALRTMESIIPMAASIEQRDRLLGKVEGMRTKLNELEGKP
jgi:hypothetical protein